MAPVKQCTIKGKIIHQRTQIEPKAINLEETIRKNMNKRQLIHYNSSISSFRLKK
jgi:hypothetical protein